MRYGIIGTGNMGAMLATCFMTSKAIEAKDIILYNRSKEKALAIKENFKDVTVAENLQQLAKESDVLFFCIKPHQFKDVLDEVKRELTESQCIVSITSPVAVEELEACTPCQVARIVPSITNRAFAGVSLFTFGRTMDEQNKILLKELFHSFSSPIEVEEEYIRVASDIVSCGPAFLSFLLKDWIESAHAVTGIPQEKATKLTEEMMAGLGNLLSKQIYTLDELMEKVTVKGGVTGEGLKALEQHLGETFEEMFKATQAKHREDKQTIKLQKS
ncbi:late competence protein ComER [Halobacillus salinarum]|uniref:Pyrroline-5-carboxylate reductase n=1 Tax=Halobacillus salinarum TaxID=2932257 RepID=A0ABY4ERI4_9BACI|nr:late competence protein ComER [Halobacillus salinarum]UOQ46322.1 late competence protein ComER [Halobacillus salinarum]